MKKAIAAIIVIALLAALLPTVALAEDDYELEIRGGNVSDNIAALDGVNCLKVDLYLNGISEERLLEAASFTLTYDSEQLLYYTDSEELGESHLYAVDGNGEPRHTTPPLYKNTANKGLLLFAFASDYGCKVEDGQPMISLYFRIHSSVEPGDEISFGLSDAFAESVVMSSMLTPNEAELSERTVTENFKPYTASEASTCTIEWNEQDFQYNGSTPYVIYNGKAQTPGFTVRDENGSVVDKSCYDYTFKENRNAGTAYLFVTFKNGYTGYCESFFKIYLPATTSTKVENIADGVSISWAPVDGAAGYVIYRRAWSSTTNGWTEFKRWYNVPHTSWVDGADSGHKVYAGTRYQYGVKAYFAERTDPFTGEKIGGNENIPSGNYNLGIVGPLKTTVRITTRSLNSVKGGSKRVTVKWTGSTVFTGYQVQLATDAAFTKNVQTVKITKASTYETVVKSLKAKTTYYVRVRSYQDFEGMTYYGEWSNVKSAKTN